MPDHLQCSNFPLAGESLAPVHSSSPAPRGDVSGGCSPPSAQGRLNCSPQPAPPPAGTGHRWLGRNWRCLKFSSFWPHFTLSAQIGRPWRGIHQAATAEKRCSGSLPWGRSSLEHLGGGAGHGGNLCCCISGSFGSGLPVAVPALSGLSHLALHMPVWSYMPPGDPEHCPSPGHFCSWGQSRWWDISTLSCSSQARFCTA